MLGQRHTIACVHVQTMCVQELDPPYTVPTANNKCSKGRRMLQPLRPPPPNTTKPMMNTDQSCT